MKNRTAKQAIRRVQESGRRAAKHERTTEIIAALVRPGVHVRQGDVLLTAIAPGSVKRGARIAERQLAPGTTQGSRHVAEGDVTLYAPAKKDPLVGPTLVVGASGCTITHPEHRHYVLPAGTEWSVTYERDLDQEERRRVQD